MAELVRFDLGDGADIVAEIDTDEPGFERVSRAGDHILAATADVDAALERVRVLAAATLDKLTRLPRRPQTVEVEFGLRFNAEAGVVIARTGAEGHLQVTLTWKDSGVARPDGE